MLLIALRLPFEINNDQKEVQSNEVVESTTNPKSQEILTETSKELQNNSSGKCEKTSNNINVTKEIINQVENKKKYIIISDQYASSLHDFLKRHYYTKVATTPDGNIYELQNPRRGYQN